MFITKKHLSRRTVLRGLGSTIALPLLDAMVPANRPSYDPAEGVTRLVAEYEAMGCAGGNDWGDQQHLFAPAKMGRDFDIVNDSQLKPLEAHREYLTIVSQTDCRMAEPFRAEEIGGDHDRSTAVFLTQSHPLQTQADVFCGKSLDQVHSERFGQDTPLPSIELSIEELGLNCDANFTCAYRNTLAWKSATLPLPMEHNPRKVFVQLFGEGDTPTP